MLPMLQTRPVAPPYTNTAHESEAARWQRRYHDINHASPGGPSLDIPGHHATSRYTFPPQIPRPLEQMAALSQQYVLNHREQSLRRKTPRGTIDDGYDGSIVPQPPLKQVMLSRSDPSLSSTGANTGNATSHPDQAHVELPSAARWSGWGSSTRDGRQADAISYGHTNGTWTSSHHHLSSNTADPTQHQHYGHANAYQAQGHILSQTAATGSFRQLAAAHNFQPGSFNIDNGWSQSSRGFEPIRQMPSTGYVPHNEPYANAYSSIQAPLPQGGLGGHFYGRNHPFRMPTAESFLDDGFSGAEYQPPNSLSPLHNNLDALTLGSNTPGESSSSSTHFKERVLAQAHQSYAALLVFLNRLKRQQGIKTPQGPRLFPQAGAPIRDHHGRSLSLSSTRTHTQGIERARLPDMSNTYLAQPSSTNTHPTTVFANVYGIASPQNRQYYGTTLPAATLQYDPSSAVANARSSLEMLGHLCEQSGWTWIDGLLLGGCLHYGLEQYQFALDWFGKIVRIDTNHVEAISNIAASWYCLGRQDAAEEHWLRAIKIRPAYLEAVEHLVGMLCASHRSREAVALITHVQQCLRLDIDDMHTCEWKRKGIGTETHQQTQQPTFTGGSNHIPVELSEGFGSSGYAIPGIENGRMLLLVHAKGNMLYALKQPEFASNAFEEAVMISAGRGIGGLVGLIGRITTVLRPENGIDQTSTQGSRLLLLPPEEAKLTASKVFVSTHGQLPGLGYLPIGSHRKSAVTTTSNALLSLAKIFQDALSAGSSIPGPRMQSTGIAPILSLYYLSLSLQESPSTANNVGILLASVQHTPSLSSMTQARPIVPNIPGIIPGSGLALALAYYSYGLGLDAKHVHLHTNLGSLFKDVGQLDLAIQMYERAVACDDTFDIALTNLANAVKDRGRVREAIHYYKRAVAANPTFAEAVCGLSTALNSVCDWRGRGGVVLQNGRYDRWHVSDDGMLRDVKAHNEATGLAKQVTDIVTRQLTEASAWGKGLLVNNEIVRLCNALRSNTCDETIDLAAELTTWVGESWEGSKILRLIERATRQTMWQWYQDKHVTGKRSIDEAEYTRVLPPKGLTVPAAPTVLPFHTFTCPLTAKDVRRISQRNAARISCSTLKSPWLPAQVYPPPSPPKPCLNVGYVSSDFGNHPLSHLMCSIFGFHDETKVKPFCYATTKSDESPFRMKIETQSVFRDASSWSSEQLIEKIVEDNIHILVNLNGYTRGARNEIFAARPVPIQMSFMGFAGTLGAEWCDYLLSDTTAVPKSTLRPWRSNLTLTDVFRDDTEGDDESYMYSENIIFCRDTFFVCDHQQAADAEEKLVDWETEQKRRWAMRKEIFPDLSDDTIILGNFNQLYKIDPSTFRTWLRILASTPKTILWLLRFPDLGEEHLLRTARHWAGEAVASRIRFTDVAPKQQHIARGRVCDLFLDTPECNAHTTATDILWSSTPLITWPKYDYKLCSRMAASILKGAVVPGEREGEKVVRELVVEDDGEYERNAIELANGLSYDMVDDESVGGARGGDGDAGIDGGDGNRGRTRYGKPRGRLAEMRKLLFDSRWTCPLFDTRRWVRDLEAAYEEAWRRWVEGEDGDIYL